MAILPVILVLMSSPDHHFHYRQGGNRRKTWIWSNMDVVVQALYPDYRNIYVHGYLLGYLHVSISKHRCEQGAPPPFLESRRKLPPKIAAI